MTAATTAMSLLDQGPTALPRVESSGMSTGASSADADARRLVTSMARGDEAAFKQLYDAYSPRLFRLALVLGRGDESLAQETVQSVFVTMAKKLRRVETADHLWNWAARIARQQIAKSWRQQQHNPVVPMEPLPDCIGTESDETLENCLDSALREMEADDRRLIESFYFEHLSHKQIAEQSGLTPKAISSRLERAREKLRLLVAKKLSHENQP